MDAILYTSQTGHTETYANFLAEKLHLPAYPLKEAGRRLPVGASVIYLGWIMAGSIKGAAKAAKRYRIELLCGVGLAEPGEIMLATLCAGHQSLCRDVFYLQGGYDGARLRGPYRYLMHIMCDSLSKKETRTPEESAMLEALTQGGDFVREENLDGILQFLEDKDHLQKNSN